MSSTMRAKMTIRSIEPHGSGASETLLFSAVTGNNGYGAGGESEDNTYALFTPAAELKMTITNPRLVGDYRVGDTFYVDFTHAERTER